MIAFLSVCLPVIQAFFAVRMSKAKVVAFFHFDFLLELFELRAESVKVVIRRDDGHFLHLQLQVLYIDDYIRFHNHVDHTKKSVAIVNNVTSFFTLVGKILLANKKSLVGLCGDMILDGMPDQAGNRPTLLLKAGNEARCPMH